MNDRSRPQAAPETPTKKSTRSVDATREFFAELDACSGPDEPAFKAAALLADAWQPALDRSYRLGYERGYVAGFYEANRVEAEAWRHLADEVVGPVLRQPTHDELRQRRGEAS